MKKERNKDGDNNNNNNNSGNSGYVIKSVWVRVIWLEGYLSVFNNAFYSSNDHVWCCCLDSTSVLA